MAILVIRQFDVFANPTAALRGKVPYVVVLQSHFLDALNTTVVAPLFRPETLPAENVVMLSIKIGDELLVLDLALLANIDRRRLSKPVGNVREHDLDIRRALDRLLTGF